MKRIYFFIYSIYIYWYVSFISIIYISFLLQAFCKQNLEMNVSVKNVVQVSLIGYVKFLLRRKGYIVQFRVEIYTFVFLLLGTGIFPVFFYIYPIVPQAPEFLHSFLFPVTVVKGIGPKHHTYFYSLVLEFCLCFSISIR